MGPMEKSVEHAMSFPITAHPAAQDPSSAIERLHGSEAIREQLGLLFKHTEGLREAIVILARHLDQ